MQSKATTVAAYLDSLPEDRRAALQALRKVILANLDKDVEEGMQYGMIGYYVPHSRYPAGYHCNPEQPLPFAALASQKNHMALYMMCIYGLPKEKEWLAKSWAQAGKKLDMGKSCVRFKKLEQVPLDVVGQAFKRISVKKYIANYESVLSTSSTKSPTTRARKA